MDGNQNNTYGQRDRPEFKIKEKIYEMIRYGAPALLQFPKVERYELAGRIRASMYKLLEYAVRVERRYYKKTTIEEWILNWTFCAI